MPRAIITVGISNSGKSTWADQKCRSDKSWYNINRDSLRFMLGGAKGWHDYKWDKAKEAIISDTVLSLCETACWENKNVIISDTNLNTLYRDALITDLKTIGFDVELKDFPITWEEAKKRNATNPKGVGDDVMLRQWNQWLTYIERPRYTPDETKPQAIIFDVDGTLADMTGVRKPYDWDRVGMDKPRQPITEMLEGYVKEGYNIIILSGRDGVCLNDTKAWLKYHHIHYDKIYMRAEGDQRKDTVIKEELFWEHIAHNYNVTACVDDRPCMVDLWHDLGVPNVIAVADQRLKF